MINKRITTYIMYITLIILSIILSIIHIIFIPRNSSNKLNSISLLWSLIILILNSILILIYNKGINFQVYDNYSWNWGDILLTVDGVSVFFITLSIILIPICIIMSWYSISNFKKEFIICLFLILRSFHYNGYYRVLYIVWRYINTNVFNYRYLRI